MTDFDKVRDELSAMQVVAEGLADDAEQAEQADDKAALALVRLVADIERARAEVLNAQVRQLFGGREL